MPPDQRHLVIRQKGCIATLVLLGISCTGVATAPCSNSEPPYVWKIEDTATATALAAAVNQCSGGVFNIKWTGNVVVEREIHVAGGTSLNVAGSDSAAAMEGSGNNRLFTVENAFLNVSNMIISNGNATFGGAIACDRSNMSFYQTSFTNNVAVKGDGGALHVANGSIVSWGGLTRFVGNGAFGGGGAAFISDSSRVSWGGIALLLSNTASRGGAIYLENNSSAFWEAETLFYDN
ncbi:unnamed protein product, partial [Sphacelaria rigidula]